MPIDGRTLPNTEPIYTFIAKDGNNTHVHAERLRQWTRRAKPEYFWVPVDPRVARSFITKNAVSLSRVLSLTLDHRTEPIIFCTDKAGTGQPERDLQMLVDGHHRYVRAVLEGDHFILSHIIPYRKWRRFEIINLPPLTEAQLAAIPLNPRNY